MEQSVLATRIIPTLLARGTQLVKGERFASWRSVGHVLQAAQIYQERGVDELILLDIAATPEGRGPDLKLVEALTRDFRSPVTVGGGVRSATDVRDLLNAGADKVSVCTAAAAADVFFVDRLVDRFGAQCIVHAIDHDAMGAAWTHCGSRPAGTCVREMAEQSPAGEILLTAIEGDGTMDGYDLEVIGAVAAAIDRPVIASGGCSGYQDMYAAIQAGASAVAAGALWQFTESTPLAAALYLKDKGVEVRLE